MIRRPDIMKYSTLKESDSAALSGGRYIKEAGGKRYEKIRKDNL